MHRITRLFAFTILSAVLLTVQQLSAQDASTPGAAMGGKTAASRWTFGFYAGALYTMHSGGFVFPDEQPPRISYDDGTGLGPALGIRVDIPLASSLRLSPRLFAECRRGTFTSDPFTMPIIGQDIEPQNAQLEDDLEVVLRVGGLDLLLLWQPFPVDAYLAAGPSIGLNLYEEFRVTGNIIAPAGVTFADGGRSRELYDDDPGKSRSMHMGIRAGAGYVFGIGHDLAVGAEILYYIPLQTVTESDDWELQSLLGSVSILFRF